MSDRLTTDRTAKENPSVLTQKSCLPKNTATPVAIWPWRTHCTGSAIIDMILPKFFRKYDAAPTVQQGIVISGFVSGL